MGADLQNLLGGMLIFAAIVTAFVLLVIFVVVPVFRGIGSGIGAIFKGVGWFITHIFEFIGGMLRDIIRFIGSVLAWIVFMLLVPLNIVIGRWSAASHFASAMKRETVVGFGCLYRVVLHRPLKLVLLDGLLEGIEQRVPEAVQYSPGADQPSRHTGQFDGYTIIGSLRGGGSGAKLYIAKPSDHKRRKMQGSPSKVVIKSFALSEGSSLPQIVRESRALECAKQLGHVLEHGMDNHRFYYVMPYHPGDHLGILTRQLHAECGNSGLDQRRLNLVTSYIGDLLETLSAYHVGGLWHKDVKPENVIVHDGSAHLVDLGLITPLRSAMTLTTHGTEYFRDPEMVKMALRGVKVHQVNGAKFDIYAAGAVLYFMLENTFPAHGGLSRFVARSPEALRWIVRRAMTDYNQRYESVDVMLADLRFVADAADPFAVRPADLPSMQGEAPPEMDPEPEVVAAAGSPRPKQPSSEHGDEVKGYAFAAGIGKKGPFFHAGRVRGGDKVNEGSQQTARRPRRPKLNVTNWWTGEYRVAKSSVQEEAEANREFRKQASEFRQQARDISRKVRDGSMSARKAAREQVKAARQRAKDIRTRALTHRHKVVNNSQSSPPAVAVGFAALIIVGSVIFFGVRSATRNRAEIPVDRFLAWQQLSAPDGDGRPVLLLVEGADASDQKVRDRLVPVLKKHERKGFDVIVDELSAEHEFRHLYEMWQDNPRGSADTALEDVLELHNLYGILHVHMSDRGGSIDDNLVRSTRKGAHDRRRIAFVGPSVPVVPDLPYLFVNDHPAKIDPLVKVRIDEIIASYTDRGWKIVINDDAEVSVRKVLPTGPIAAGADVSPVVHTTLAENNLGGVIRIDAIHGEGPAHERIGITQIDIDPTAASQANGNSSAVTSSLAPKS